MLRHLKWRLVLFFVVETLAIAAMIALFRASRRPACNVFLGTCVTPSGQGMILGLAGIVGELGVLTAILKMERPAWAAMLGLGLCSFFTAMLFFVSLATLFVTAPYSEILAFWHFRAAIALVGAGLVGGVHAVLLRVRIRGLAARGRV